jgi:hypothetical protein
LLLKTAPVQNNPQEPPKLHGYCYPGASSNAIQANKIQSDLTQLLSGKLGFVSIQCGSALQLPAARSLSAQNGSGSARAILPFTVSRQTNNSCELPDATTPILEKKGVRMILHLLRGWESSPINEMSLADGHLRSTQSFDCKQLPVHNRGLRRKRSRRFAFTSSANRKYQIDSCESIGRSDLLQREQRNSKNQRPLRGSSSNLKRQNLSGQGRARRTCTTAIRWLPTGWQQTRSVESSLCVVFSRPSQMVTTSSCEPIAEPDPVKLKGRRIRIRSLLRVIRITPETVRGSPLEHVRLPYRYGKKKLYKSN